jgi:hypothetical protein
MLVVPFCGPGIIIVKNYYIEVRFVDICEIVDHHQTKNIILSFENLLKF